MIGGERRDGRNRSLAYDPQCRRTFTRRGPRPGRVCLARAVALQRRVKVRPDPLAVATNRLTTTTADSAPPRSAQVPPRRPTIAAGPHENRSGRCLWRCQGCSTAFGKGDGTMQRFLRFGAAAVLVAAAGSAQAGLFGFGSPRSGCCETDCCEEVGCVEECSSAGCRTKRGGLFGRLFGCFKGRSSTSDCCEADCCDVGCNETVGTTPVYGGTAPSGEFRGYGVSQPATVGRPVQMPASSVAPMPPQSARPAAPAPPVAPRPEVQPVPPSAEDGEVYFPSRLRTPTGSASGAASEFPSVR